MPLSSWFLRSVMMICFVAFGMACSHSKSPTIVDLGNGKFTATYQGERGENVLAALDKEVTEFCRDYVTSRGIPVTRAKYHSKLVKKKKYSISMERGKCIAAGVASGDGSQ